MQNAGESTLSRQRGAGGESRPLLACAPALRHFQIRKIALDFLHHDI
jgi:hypothetical protein